MHHASKPVLTLTSVIFLLAAAGPSPAAPGDWPQWRGVNRDDLCTETGLLKEWPTDGPPLVWKATGLGAGHGGVAVAGGRMFTTGDKGESSFLVALGAADGKVLWTAKIGRPGGGPPGPRSTPTVDGNLVFCLGQHGELVCVDSVTVEAEAESAPGKEIWRKHLVKDFGGKCGGWLYAESPLVDGDKLICTPGGARGTMIALDKKTGALLWQTAGFTDSAEYSSPIVASIGGVRQYVQLTGRSVVGVAEDGRVLWRAARRGQTATVPTPIVHNDHVFVTSGYGIGCNLFKISKDGDSFNAAQVYANKNMVNHHGGVVLVGQHLYGYSDGKGWVCMDFETGELVWRNEGVGKGAILCADGHLYTRSEGGKGRIALVEATPSGCKQTGRFEQPDRSKENSWPHPVIAGGRLYLRDQDILLCYDVKQK